MAFALRLTAVISALLLAATSVAAASGAAQADTVQGLTEVGAVEFAAGSEAISPAAQRELQRIAAQFKSSGSGRLVVRFDIGAGDDEAERMLSARKRGNEIRWFLEATGVPRDLMETDEVAPTASGDPNRAFILLGPSDSGW